jgi:D-alanyl-D-alanine carboxypeptidase/D-alanyl-D-alanine-endopeptidase (penicillin-binding protein 4)
MKANMTKFSDFINSFSKISQILLIYQFLIIFSFTSLKAQSVEPQLTKKIGDYIQDKNAELGQQAKISLLVERISDGSPVFSQSVQEAQHMASVQKILISYVALKILGAEHKFITEIYTDKKLESEMSSDGMSLVPDFEVEKKVTIDSLPSVYVRPYGNPLMQYEDLLLIARELSIRGINKIDSLVLDSSLFLDPTEASGLESYKAAQTAATLEFNTFRVDVSPSKITEKALITLSPGYFGEVINRTKTLRSNTARIDFIQSPDYQSFIGKKMLLQGEFNPTKLKLQVEGSIGIKDKVYTQYFAHPEPNAYFLNAFKKAILQSGISMSGSIRYGAVPKDSKLIYEHQSQSLSYILNNLNHFSNNFIAGQLLFAIGQDSRGFFSKEKGMQVLKETLSKFPEFNKDYNLADSSGLSTENRISPEQVLAILKAAYSDMGIGPVFISSLSRFGISGTLEDRFLLGSQDEYQVKTFSYLDQKQRADSVWAKTGTVNKISAVSGYVEAFSHQILGFSIVINGELEKKRAIEIENDIIKILLGLTR